MTVTWALAIAAPDESVTVPVIEAVSCANSTVGRPIENTRTKKHRRRDFIINSLICKLRQKLTQALPPENPGQLPQHVLRDIEIYFRSTVPAQNGHKPSNRL